MNHKAEPRGRYKVDHPVDGDIGRALWEKADKVLPGGGIYRSRSADMAGRGVLPGFIASATGCRVTDVDGKSYIDFMGANGPNILGYGHPEIEAVVRRQMETMTSASLFPPALVEVVERLVQRFDGMEWGVVSKNGSEVVSLGARIARQHTKRPGLITFQRAYHGNDPEFAAAPPAGPLADITSRVFRLPWNDPQALIDHARAHGDNIAAIVLNPVDQTPMTDTEFANADFISAINLVRDRHGIQLVLDDVRHGFRLHPKGSHHLLGLTPDLLALGKALGNGHAISTVVGQEHLRSAARKILYTSTYMFEAPPMQAAMKMMEIYDRDDVFDHMNDMGTRLQLGLLSAGKREGHDISYSGPVTMPTLLFLNDPDGIKGRTFAHEAAIRGSILHPVLNWNLSAAHTPDDIDETIEIASHAFAATPVDM